MSKTITASDLQENDIVEIRQLGTPVVVMVHHIDHDGDHVRFRYLTEDDRLTGSVDAREDDTFRWWGR